MTDSSNKLEDVWLLEQTTLWLKKAVIGLNLCPFAKSVYVKNQIHYRLSKNSDDASCLAIMEEEMMALTIIPAHIRDTTLVLFPLGYEEFWLFNILLNSSQKRLKSLGLKGVLQLASFHPSFEFRNETPDDMSHFTNRSPVPMLHILREASITQAVHGDMNEADRIFTRNKKTLRGIGATGWNALGLAITAVDDGVQ
jgi:uncharacterized protein